jgi:methanethiol S-methyltransferase
MAQNRSASLLFAWCGAAVFVFSLLFFLYRYLIRFGDPVAETHWMRPVIIDTLLFTIFAFHHSLFARPWVKERVQRIVPAALERSLYTWVASVLFVAVCALWRGLPGELYHLRGMAESIAYVVQAAGAVVTIRSSARLDVLDLAGVRPVLHSLQNSSSPAHVSLETSGLYGFVRHPLYLGWALTVFAAPHMTLTRFVFATISTLYLAAAIPLEEHALIGVFGSEYRDYQKRVRWRMVPGIY